MMKPSHLCSFLLLAASCVTGIAQTQQSSPCGLTDQARGGCDKYRVQLSDTLSLTLPYSPEYDQTLSVQPDGSISLREAGTLQAVGVTIADLEERIAAAYRPLLREPRVSIALKDFQKPSYFASGEIGRPGRYELRAQTSLLQAISEAGGVINERAKKTHVIVFRPQGNGTYESHVIDLKALLNAHQPFEDYTIHPGDVVYVPQNGFSKIARFVPTSSIGTFVSPAF